MTKEVNEPKETAECKYIVEIVWDDGGETYHGPFDTEDAAVEWVEQYVGDDHTADGWNVLPLNVPVVL